MSALGHSRPSHLVPVLNNVRYASDSDHSGYEFELTLWAISGHQSDRSRRAPVTQVLFFIGKLKDPAASLSRYPHYRSRR